MSGILAAVLGSKIGRTALLVAGAVLALLLAMARIFAAGRKAERVKSLEKSLEAEHARKQVDLDVSAADPAERDRLRKKWSAR